jgi:hypothetical protein
MYLCVHTHTHTHTHTHIHTHTHTHILEKTGTIRLVKARRELDWTGLDWARAHYHMIGDNGRADNYIYLLIASTYNLTRTSSAGQSVKKGLVLINQVALIACQPR